MKLTQSHLYTKTKISLLTAIFSVPLMLLSLSSQAHEAQVVNMNSLDEFGLYQGCLKVDGKLMPDGCEFDETKSLIMKGLTTDTVRLQYMVMRPGSKSPNHNHPDEEVFYLVSGKLRVVGGEDTHILEPDDVFIVPSYMYHEFEALEESVFIEVGGPGPMLTKMPGLKQLGGDVNFKLDEDE